MPEKEQAVYTSPSWVRRYLVQLKRVPSLVLDRKEAEALGARHRNYPQLISALRALGVVDEEGRATEDLGKRLARSGREYQEAVKDLLERSYPTFMRWLKERHAMDAQELRNHIARISSLGESAQRQAVTLFRFWVGESGDEEWIQAAGQPRTREKRPTSDSLPTRPETGRRRSPTAASRSQQRTPEVLSPRLPDWQDVYASQTMHYRFTLQLPRGGKVDEAALEHIKQQIAAEIDYLKVQHSGRKNEGEG